MSTKIYDEVTVTRQLIGSDIDKVEYVTSDNNTTEPTSGWSTTWPSKVLETQYVWTRITWIKEDGTKEYTYSCSGRKGTEGASVPNIVANPNYYQWGKDVAISITYGHETYPTGSADSETTSETTDEKTGKTTKTTVGIIAVEDLKFLGKQCYLKSSDTDFKLIINNNKIYLDVPSGTTKKLKNITVSLGYYDGDKKTANFHEIDVKTICPYTPDLHIELSDDNLATSSEKGTVTAKLVIGGQAVIPDTGWTVTDSAGNTIAWTQISEQDQAAGIKITATASISYTVQATYDGVTVSAQFKILQVKDGKNAQPYEIDSTAVIHRGPFQDSSTDIIFTAQTTTGGSDENTLIPGTSGVLVAYFGRPGQWSSGNNLASKPLSTETHSITIEASAIKANESDLQVYWFDTWDSTAKTPGKIMYARDTVEYIDSNFDISVDPSYLLLEADSAGKVAMSGETLTAQAYQDGTALDSGVTYTWWWNGVSPSQSWLLGTGATCTEKTWQQLAAETLQSSSNLVKNGYGEYKDNTNFTLKYNTVTDADKTTLGSDVYGYFSNGGFTTEAIPFDINYTYNVEYYYRRKTTGNAYFGIVPYDVDGNHITSRNVMNYNQNLFYLAKDLKKGDTVVYFKSLAKWNVKTSQDYQREFLFFGYKDSTGYTYPDGTYSQYSYPKIYNADTDVNTTNNTITLKAAWTGREFSAGTAVAQVSDGFTYCYIGNLNDSTETNVWKKNTGAISEKGWGASYWRRMKYAKSFKLAFMSSTIVDFAKISVRKYFSGAWNSFTTDGTIAKWQKSTTDSSLAFTGVSGTWDSIKIHCTATKNEATNIKRTATVQIAKNKAGATGEKGDTGATGDNAVQYEIDTNFTEMYVTLYQDTSTDSNGKAISTKTFQYTTNGSAKTINAAANTSMGSFFNAKIYQINGKNRTELPNPPGTITWSSYNGTSQKSTVSGASVAGVSYGSSSSGIKCFPFYDVSDTATGKTHIASYNSMIESQYYVTVTYTLKGETTPRAIKTIPLRRALSNVLAKFETTAYGFNDLTQDGTKGIKFEAANGMEMYVKDIADVGSSNVFSIYTGEANSTNGDKGDAVFQVTNSGDVTMSGTLSMSGLEKVYIFAPQDYIYCSDYWSGTNLSADSRLYFNASLADRITEKIPTSLGLVSTASVSKESEDWVSKDQDNLPLALKQRYKYFYQYTGTNTAPYFKTDDTNVSLLPVLVTNQGISTGYGALKTLIAEESVINKLYTLKILGGNKYVPFQIGDETWDYLKIFGDKITIKACDLHLKSFVEKTTLTSSVDQRLLLGGSGVREAKVFSGTDDVGYFNQVTDPTADQKDKYYYRFGYRSEMSEAFQEAVPNYNGLDGYFIKVSDIQDHEFDPTSKQYYTLKNGMKEPEPVGYLQSISPHYNSNLSFNPSTQTLSTKNISLSSGGKITVINPGGSWGSITSTGTLQTICNYGNGDNAESNTYTPVFSLKHSTNGDTWVAGALLYSGADSYPTASNYFSFEYVNSSGTRTTMMTLNRGSSVGIRVPLVIRQTLTATGLITADGGINTKALSATTGKFTSTLTASGGISATTGTFSSTLKATGLITADGGINTKALSATTGKFTSTLTASGGKLSVTVDSPKTSVRLNARNSAGIGWDNDNYPLTYQEDNNYAVYGKGSPIVVEVGNDTGNVYPILTWNCSYNNEYYSFVMRNDKLYLIKRHRNTTGEWKTYMILMENNWSESW